MLAPYSLAGILLTFLHGAREYVQESDALRRKLDDDLRAKDQRISQLGAELDDFKQVRTTRGRPSRHREEFQIATAPTSGCPLHLGWLHTVQFCFFLYRVLPTKRCVLPSASHLGHPCMHACMGRPCHIPLPTRPMHLHLPCVHQATSPYTPDLPVHSLMPFRPARPDCPARPLSSAPSSRPSRPDLVPLFIPSGV